jgi:hypothetical protein
MDRRRSSTPRRAAAGLALLAGLVAAGCNLTQPRPANEEPKTTLGSGDRVVEARRCAVSVVILTRPADDPVLQEKAWQAADEQILGPELRRAYLANGVRIGRISGELPAELAAMLRAGPPDQPDVQMLVNPSGQSSLIDATHTPPRPESHVLLSTPAGLVRGKVYADAKAFLRITPAHEGREAVALKVTPEIHHGPVRPGYGVLPNAGVMAPREFRITSGQAEETLRELEATITLEPGQVALIGMRSDRESSLGDMLFGSLEGESDRRLQSLVLIWARRNTTESGGLGLLDAPPALLPMGADEVEKIAPLAAGGTADAGASPRPPAAR